MIRFIFGNVLHKKNQEIVVNVNGIGYGVFVSSSLFEKISIGDTVNLHVYSHVRENEISLYGFETERDRYFFELLISVSGIGPKVALSVLSFRSVDDICSSIIKEDASILMGVSGIGKKTAKKVILELQGKIDAIDFEQSKSLDLDISSIEALKSMGYSEKEARMALSQVDSNIDSVGEKVRLALKVMNKF